MSSASTVKPVEELAVSDDDLQEPMSLLEAIRILRSRNPHYAAIMCPSKEQIEDLDVVIKGLRFQIVEGTVAEEGDETAFELAVALLWHKNMLLIEEGIELMEYLLKERWDMHWTAVTGSRAGPQQTLVEGVVDEDKGNRMGEEAGSEEEWVDIGAPEGEMGGYSAAWTAPNSFSKSVAGCRGVVVGTAILGATAPPPPEEEDSSVPPSLVRERSALMTRSSAVCTSFSGAASAASTMTTTTNLRNTRASTATSAAADSSSSYTSPGVDSSIGATNTVTSVSKADAVAMWDEQLSKYYYHLAIGYTKLRRNGKALFYVDNMLRLSPKNKDGLRLRRLLCARLYVSRTLVQSVPFLALGFLFL